MTRTLPLLIALTTLLPHTLHAAPVAVDTCGQVVTSGGFLTGDLDCTGFPGVALTIERGSLALNGHTLTGGLLTAVQCERSCKIDGPGSITGSGAFGVATAKNGKLTAVNLTDNGLAGVQCMKKCRVRGPATISGNGNNGIRARSAVVRDVMLSGNGNAAVDATTNDDKGKAQLRDCVVTGNDTGVFADRKVILRDTIVSGNEGHGVIVGTAPTCEHVGAVRLRDSDVTGNGTGADCGVARTCADLATCRTVPKLKGTSACDTSYMVDSGFPGNDWDTCAND